MSELLKKGDYVVMNGKYFVAEEFNGQVFLVHSFLGKISGREYVRLRRYPGLAFAVESLTLISRDEAEDLLEKNIGEERLQELQSDYENETCDEETQEWREDLTNQELLLVRIWDRRFAGGVSSILEHMRGGETV